MKKYMEKLILSVLLVNCSFLYALAAGLDGKTILEKVDENYTAENRRAIFTMIIRGRRGTRTIQAESWVQGIEKSFTVYLSPAREKGTKMLKLGDELWIYSPSSDRTIKIAGHMLRQSLMGSDVSYEDSMEDPKLSNMYNSELTGEEKVASRDCYVLQLTALFAKSGKLLKTLVVNEVFKVGKRWYPKRMTFKDVLKKGSGTEFIIDSIEFDIKIPEHIFSKASLRK